METSMSSEQRERECKYFHLISDRGSQLFIGWFHSRPGGPHFDPFNAQSVLLLLLEKVGQKRKLITVASRRNMLK